jgi:hypothetical protein
VETSPAPRRSTIFMQAHMIEQSVSGGLGRLGERIDTSELGRGAAECPCGVVRQVVLATRGAPATMLSFWDFSSALKREREKGHERLEEGQIMFSPALGPRNRCDQVKRVHKHLVRDIVY